MWKIRNIINGGGQYLEGRYVTNYLELHDEAWPSSGGQRIVKTIDTTFPHDDVWAKGRVKLAQGVVMTAPGIPAMLMGSEWLEDTDFGTDSGNRIDWSKKTTYAPIFAYFSDLITLSVGDFETRLLSKAAILPTAGFFMGYQISRSFSLRISCYAPLIIEKSTSKPLSLATIT